MLSAVRYDRSRLLPEKCVRSKRLFRRKWSNDRLFRFLLGNSFISLHIEDLLHFCRFLIGIFPSELGIFNSKKYNSTKQYFTACDMHSFLVRFSLRACANSAAATHSSVVGIHPVFTSTNWRAVGTELCSRTQNGTFSWLTVYISRWILAVARKN